MNTTMARKLTTISLIILSGALASCSSTPEKGISCVFPDAPKTNAPSWVCSEHLDGYSLTSVGVSEKSIAGYNFMKQMAATSARVSLAQILKVQVQNMMTQYVATTGSADSETLDKTSTSVTKLITDNSLVGSRIVTSVTSPKGSLYVIVAISEDGIKEVAKSSILSSMNNDKALWQQFKAKQGQQELAQSIANTKVK